MKKLLILLSLVSLYSYSQIEIYPLTFKYKFDLQDAYVKDMNNELNSFEGTWIYSDSNVTFEIQLDKQLMVAVQGDGYLQDRIRGEFRYVENGIEKVNTLSRLNDSIPHPAFNDHQINGNILLRDCRVFTEDDCLPGEVRLMLGILDPRTQDHYGTMVLKHRVINGQACLKVLVYFDPVVTDGPPEGLIVPDPPMPWKKEYTMVKQ